jgi:L-ascorbate metabolism protein UlaG (beta-lactamase superfamily)
VPAPSPFRLEDGFTIYFAGDERLRRHVADRSLYSPDLAVLPIGDHFTTGPREAALALELLGVIRCVPCHYGTFPLLFGTPDELRAPARQESRCFHPSPARLSL